MHSIERIKFIEKFKKNHVKDISNIISAKEKEEQEYKKNNITKQSCRTNEKLLLNNNSNNNISLSLSKVSIKNMGNIYKNKSLCKFDDKDLRCYTYSPKRWDYLYQLAKIKKTEMSNKINKKKEEDNKKFKSEYTFKPRIYTKKLNSKYFDKYPNCSIKTEIYNVTTTCNSNNKIHNSDNIKNYIDDYTNYNEFNNNIVDCSINQRTKIWSRKKEIKNENIKQQLNNKEIDECYFSPNINENVLTNNIKTKDAIVNYESFLHYINRIRGLRNMQKNEDIVINNKPGTGNCWKKGITLNNEFNLRTEKRHILHNQNYDDIKSLNMPIMLNKFYIKNDDKLCFKSSNKNTTQLITHSNIEKFMSYENALVYLHNALYTLDI